MRIPKIGEIWKITYIGRNQEIESDQTLWECVNYNRNLEEFDFLNINYDSIEKSYKRKRKFFNHNLFSHSIPKSKLGKYRMEFVRFDAGCYNKIINESIKEIDEEIRESRKEIARYEKERKLWKARIKKSSFLIKS